jgi:hypothetical protein
VAWHCEQHGWDDAAFRHSENVYQLALRAGTSYTATCWTLLRYRIVDRTTANQLANIEPKAIKKNLLAGARPSNFFGDVWVLTDRDTGTRIEGGPSDLFVMRLTEHPSAGYLWRVEALDGDGFAVMHGRVLRPPRKSAAQSLAALQRNHAVASRANSDLPRAARGSRPHRVTPLNCTMTSLVRSRRDGRVRRGAIGLRQRDDDRNHVRPPCNVRTCARSG